MNQNILISSLTTIRLGGPAKYVIEVESPADIQHAYNFAGLQHLPTFVLGYGANTIGRDEGFPGVIIINRMRGISEIPAERGKVRLLVMGGELWDRVVEFTTSRGLTGIEALSRIPGLAGAAPVQNIGAYGQELADTFISADVYDTTTHSFKTLVKSEMGFGYRRSLLNTTEKNRYFVVSITLELHPGQMPTPYYHSIDQYIAEHDCKEFSPAGMRNIVSAIRAEKLPDPLERPSAGSFFKNVYLDESGIEMAEDKGYPVYRGHDGYKISSAWLIEHAGLSGKLIHGFRVNPKAPLVLLNESATSYRDLDAARSEIIKTVYDKYGYWLEQEPVEIV